MARKLIKNTYNARARFPLLVLSTCSVFGSKQKGTWDNRVVLSGATHVRKTWKFANREGTFKIKLRKRRAQTIFLTCPCKLYKDMVDHRSYTHNVRNCEIKAWKKGTNSDLKPVISNDVSWIAKTSSATGMQQCKIKLRVMLKVASSIGNRITSQVE